MILMPDSIKVQGRASAQVQHSGKHLNRIASVEGALACLVKDYNVFGLAVQHDAQELF